MELSRRFQASIENMVAPTVTGVLLGDRWSDNGASFVRLPNEEDIVWMVDSDGAEVLRLRRSQGRWYIEMSGTALRECDAFGEMLTGLSAQVAWIEADIVSGTITSANAADVLSLNKSPPGMPSGAIRQGTIVE